MKLLLIIALMLAPIAQAEDYLIFRNNDGSINGYGSKGSTIMMLPTQVEDDNKDAAYLEGFRQRLRDDYQRNMDSFNRQIEEMISD